jgi:Zn-dependent protease
MELISKIFIYAVPILLAVSLHEASHGWIAHLLGDPTAKQLGRLTANPLKHIDPVGTVLIPAVMVFLIGFPFGWAKPVPVDVRNFVSPLKDMALVALAGPVANLLMSIFWLIVLLISVRLLPQGGGLAFMLKSMAVVGIQINAVLMILNLLPVPPLDGGRIVTGVLPPNLAVYFIKYEMVGMWVVIFLLASGNLGKILMPLVEAFQLTLYSLFGLA